MRDSFNQPSHETAKQVISQARQSLLVNEGKIIYAGVSKVVFDCVRETLNDLKDNIDFCVQVVDENLENRMNVTKANASGGLERAKTSLERRLKDENPLKGGYYLKQALQSTETFLADYKDSDWTPSGAVHNKTTSADDDSSIQKTKAAGRSGGAKRMVAAEDVGEKAKDDHRSAVRGAHTQATRAFKATDSELIVKRKKETLGLGVSPFNTHSPSGGRGGRSR